MRIRNLRIQCPEKEWYRPRDNADQITGLLATAATWGILPVVPKGRLTEATTVVVTSVLIFLAYVTGQSIYVQHIASDYVPLAITVAWIAMIAFCVGNYLRPSAWRLRRAFITALYRDHKIVMVAALRPAPPSRQDRTAVRRELMQHIRQKSAGPPAT